MQLSSKFTFITFSTDSIFGNSQQSRKQPNTNRSLVIVIIIIITDVIIIIIMADVFSLSMQMSHFHDNALLVGLAAVSVSVLSVYYCAFIPQEETSSSRFIVTLFSVFGKSLLFWFSWFQDFDPNRTEKVSDLKILSWGASPVFFLMIFTLELKKIYFLVQPR